jgi:hypothetical protein
VAEGFLIKYSRALDIRDRDSLMETKADVLTRFAYIIHSIGDVYDIPRASLHAFYDVKGTMVAFNQNGKIFLSLKSFEDRRKSSLFSQLFDR